MVITADVFHFIGETQNNININNNNNKSNNNNNNNNKRITIK